jgi:hypothetical protein
MGILEVITLLLTLSGAGVDKNTKAPKGDAVLTYAVADADAVVHLDAAAILPRNVKVLLAMADDPAVKASPDLVKIAKEIKANVDGVRSMAKALAGMDPVEDISSVTAFVTLDAGSGEPVPLIVVRGAFPKDLLGKLADLTGSKTGSIDGRDTMTFEGMLVGTAKDGALIAGPAALAEPRLDDDWKPAKPKKGSAWATIGKELDQAPFFLVASKLSADKRKLAAGAIGDNFLGSLIAGHELAVLSLRHDGLALHWKATSKASLEQVTLATEGLIEVMRAMHVAPRGAAKIVVAALGSYAGKDKGLDAVIARKDDLLALVADFTGDGKFDVDSKVNKKGLTLDVRATGKKLSDVVPVSVVVPMFAGAFLLAGADAPAAAASQPAKAPPAKTRQPAPPRKGGGLDKVPTGGTRKKTGK